MEKWRLEKDSMGSVKVPLDALYGAQTQRAINNFTISNLKMPTIFIKSLATVKKVAALVNKETSLLKEEVANAIVHAANEIIDGKHLDHFPVDVFQTGSGTSTNMNMNEVIARLASTNSHFKVNPNDHVNMCQSSNDVIPTTIHVSIAIEIHKRLLPSLEGLYKVIMSKADSVENVCKIGRTHLMDAMPIQFKQELMGWAAQIKDSILRFKDSLLRLCHLAQGGTAVGTGINAEKDFPQNFNQKLSEILGINFSPSSSFFASLSSQDTAVEVSGQLKTLAVVFMKIVNDLRLMNSGPLAGLGEIELPALQPGSSIMPGKVNPVIPEAIAMVSAQVIGNDTTITIAGQSGSFQLNVMLPLIAYNLLQSISLLSNSAMSLADKVIKGFKVNYENIERNLAKNPILVTALNPIIGYSKSAEIVKKAYQEKRPIIDVAEEMTDIDRKSLKKILDPITLTHDGIQK